MKLANDEEGEARRFVNNYAIDSKFRVKSKLKQYYLYDNFNI